MEEFIKVKVVQDYDYHWYIIPEELNSLFYELLNNIDHGNNEDYFIETFSQYMTGGGLNLTQLYIKK